MLVAVAGIIVAFGVIVIVGVALGKIVCVADAVASIGMALTLIGVLGIAGGWVAGLVHASNTVVKLMIIPVRSDIIPLR